MRGTSFVVRIESAQPATARAAADTLRAMLHLRGATGTLVEAGERALPGTTIIVGVRDLANDGAPRWLAPLLVRDDAEGAAADAIAFLERWGFITRAAATTASVRVT